MNESKMPQLLWFFRYNVSLKNSVWEKSKWVWRDTGRDRKRIGICKHDVCFYHIRDYKSDKKNLAWYWPPPILWASLRFEGCLISLHQLPNQLFFKPKYGAVRCAAVTPKICFCGHLTSSAAPDLDLAFAATLNQVQWQALPRLPLWTLQLLWKITVLNPE